MFFFTQSIADNIFKNYAHSLAAISLESLPALNERNIFDLPSIIF